MNKSLPARLFCLYNNTIMKSYEKHINGNLYAYGANNPVHYIDPDGNEIKSVPYLLQSSSNAILGFSSNTTIKDEGCTLTVYYRMAKALGFRGSLEDANQYAKSHNLFTASKNGERNLLTVTNGAELVTGLVNDPDVKVTYDSSVSGSVNNMAKGLIKKDSEKKLYFSSLRLLTGNSSNTKDYEHSLSINSNPVFINDLNDIDNALGFYYSDTSAADRKGTNDTTRKNIPQRIDFFLIQIQTRNGNE